MATGSGEDERGWATEKRDFVADRRDEIADERDAAAHAREAELDQWERQSAARTSPLGVPAGGAEGDEQPAEDGAERSLGRQNRDESRVDREIAAAARDEATKRRQADAPPTRLAMAFAQIAEQLFDADSYDDVLLRIAEATVSTVAGCRMASVTVLERRGYRTAASTESAATAVDHAQYQAHEGPCLDAVHTPMVYAQSFPDQRWPRLGSHPSDSGVESALSYRLAAGSRRTADAGGGSLNSYGVTPSAFSDAAQEIGLVLAVHASVAARAVHERNALEDDGRGLQEALLSRDTIGQAKGILMERLKVTPEDAFDLLRRASQNLNVKLRELAQRLAESGEFDDKNSWRLR